MTERETTTSTQNLRIHWAQASVPGRRARNEDRTGSRQRGAQALFVLADGMGGHPGGDRAAEMVVASVLRAFEDQTASVDPAAWVRVASQELRDHGAAHSLYRNLGTTVVLVRIAGTELTHVHAGDSRLYRFRDGSLELLTPPHELTEVLKREGVLSEEEARMSPVRGRLTSYVGMVSMLVGEGRCALKSGDRYLLVSDGALEGGVERLAHVLSGSDLNRVAAEVVSGYPSDDNATALVVEIDGKGNPCSVN